MHSALAHLLVPTRNFLARQMSVSLNRNRRRWTFFLLVFLSLGCTLCAARTSAPPQSDSTLIAALGKRLFFEKRLSANGSVSCATCHSPDKAFSDRRGTSVGVGAKPLSRNAPSLLDVKDRFELFWDGRARSLEEQAKQPLLNPAEQGFTNEQSLMDAVAAIPGLSSEFQRAFPQSRASANLANLCISLAAYEKTLVSGPNSLDAYLGGHADALSNSARRGLSLFVGRGGCARCHSISGNRPSLSDGRYHQAPLGLSDSIAEQLPELTQRVRALRSKGQFDVLSQLIATQPDIAALGRFLVTLNPSDIGAFRTPSLRNVAITAPYMHDGSVPTLERAIALELYRRDGVGRRPIELSEDERADLLAFLNALTTY